MMQAATDPSSPPWVIVVNDDSAVRNSLKFVLEIVGYAVTAHPAALLPKIEHELERAACLVIDHELSPVRGLDLLVSLRRRGLRVPAVLTAVQLAMQHLQRAQDCSVSLVYKPIVDDALLLAVAKAVANGGTLRAS